MNAAINALGRRKLSNSHVHRQSLTSYSVKKPRHEESFDPAVVAAVEAKLRALGVDDDPPTSEPEHA